MAGALDGVKVVELTSYISGPYAGMLLADFGADVTKIEPPPHGDPFRGWGSSGDNPFFGSVNRNKKSVVLDLKNGDELKRALGLIDQADVVIENYRAGALDRLGLGYSRVAQSNPRLIYCSITGFGDFGPYAHKPGFDTVGQAMGGLLSLLTDTNKPKPMGISLSDHLAGMVACNGIMAALYSREKTGHGQKVDTSLLEATTSFVGENAATFFEGRNVPTRATRTHSALVFAFVDCDGLPFAIHLSSPPKFWEGLTRAVERPEWIDDPRFQNRGSRSANYESLDQELAEIFCQKTRQEWLRRLEQEDVPACAINNLQEAFEDPQVKALGMVVRLPHPRRGHVDLVRNGVRLSRTPTTIHSPAPALGQHNEGLFGRTDDDSAKR
jgi:crotonobetainyl-CoA:carnitine CoA-transferase CaiB-like acyl-CoA transferase